MLATCGCGIGQPSCLVDYDFIQYGLVASGKLSNNCMGCSAYVHHFKGIFCSAALGVGSYLASYQNAIQA